MDRRARDPEAVGGAPPRELCAFEGLLASVADRCREGGPAVAARLLGGHGAILASYEPSLRPFSRGMGRLEQRGSRSASARRRLFGVLANVLRQVALDGPLLLVLDDLQWADQLSLAFLASVPAGFFRSTPIVVLGLHRAEARSGLLASAAARDHATRSSLGPLELADVASIVRDMLALPASPKELARLVHERSKGNPLSAAQWIGRLVRDNSIEHRCGTWRRADMPSRPLPTARCSA